MSGTLNPTKFMIEPKFSTIFFGIMCHSLCVIREKRQEKQ